MASRKAKPDDEAISLTSSQMLDNIDVQRAIGGSSAITDILASELRRRYRLLLDRAGGDHAAEVAAASAGLPPDCFARTPIIRRVPYLEQALGRIPYPGAKEEKTTATAARATPKPVFNSPRGVLTIDGESYNLEATEGDVVKALIENSPANLQTLRNESNCDKPHVVLRRIIKKYPAVAPHVTLPGKKGAGG